MGNLGLDIVPTGAIRSLPPLVKGSEPA